MFVEAVGVEPTKAEWQQIYSLPSLTAGAHLNFFVFLWKQLESNQFLRIFSPSHRPPLLCFHIFFVASQGLEPRQQWFRTICTTIML